jgi:Cu2+-exporting ATPase
MLTGEGEPEAVAAGARVFAGTLNLTGPLTVSVTARAGDTLLAGIIRLMESAERSASRYVRLADRASRLYAPAVHLLALATALGWLAAGAGWHVALTDAVAVLIITCPCALGLAVPAVQVVASGALLARGVMLKDGSALERLALADIATFDKTGTLTEGAPRLIEAPELTAAERAVAAALGAASRHPLARALAKALGDAPAPAALTAIAERPGAGMTARLGDADVRLGRRAFVGGAEGDDAAHAGSEIWLRIGTAAPKRFAFTDAVRSDAAAVIAALRAEGIGAVVLSGDRPAAVAAAASAVGIADWNAGVGPSAKAAVICDLEARGHRVLMVGDGLNDAPALASAFVSMSPASAADISQNAADLVFTGNKLAPVLYAVRMAKAARGLIFQNFALAIAYNAIAVPLAILGHVTPLVAAVAMSSSSIIVTANALRLRLVGRERPATTAGAGTRLAQAAS